MAWKSGVKHPKFMHVSFSNGTLGQFSGRFWLCYWIATQNIFGGVYNHLGALIRTAAADPFKQTSLQKLKEAVHVFATMKVQNQVSSLLDF